MLQAPAVQKGLPPQATCELRDLLRTAPTTSPLAGQEHLSAMLRDMLTATWFKFEASSLVAVTHKGTRPGDPAADVLFAFTLSSLFRAIESCLETNGLVDALPAVQQEPLVDGYSCAPQLQFASWADDFARPFIADTPIDILDKARKATQCCTERASSCGIELTFGGDKTAAVCDVRTVQSLREAGVDVIAQGVEFTDAVADRHCTLPVVHAYKHLGGIFSATAKPDLEIFLRRAAALSPLRPVRNKLFANRAVPLATRRTLLYALGLARFIHGAGALHLDQKGHQRAWHSAYVNIWAHLVPCLPGSKPHSFQVLLVSKAPPPHLFLASLRAALLVRLVSRCFVSVLHLLQLEWETAQAQSWLSQIVRDIKAVSLWVQTVSNFGQGRWPLHALCRQTELDPTWWPSCVRQAFKAYAADIVKWQSLPKLVSVPEGGAFRCNLCDDSFAQRSFLTVHLARKHQLYAPARHFAPHRQCVACLRTFSTVMLAQAHLRRNPACLRRAAWLMDPLDVEAIVAAESADKQVCKLVKRGGWQRQATVLRAQQGSGPLHVTAVDIESHPDAFSITTLARQFRPREDVVQWLEQYLASTTRSGPRQVAVSWWCKKPP